MSNRLTAMPAAERLTPYRIRKNCSREETLAELNRAADRRTDRLIASMAKAEQRETEALKLQRESLELQRLALRHSEQQMEEDRRATDRAASQADAFMALLEQQTAIMATIARRLQRGRASRKGMQLKRRVRPFDHRIVTPHSAPPVSPICTLPASQASVPDAMEDLESETPLPSSIDLLDTPQQSVLASRSRCRPEKHNS